MSSLKTTKNRKINNKSTTKEFTANYHKLQSIAEHLKNNQSIDLDQLLPMIKEATNAYEKCRDRLNAVELALNAYFNKNT